LAEELISAKCVSRDHKERPETLVSYTVDQASIVFKRLYLLASGSPIIFGTLVPPTYGTVGTLMLIL